MFFTKNYEMTEKYGIRIEPSYVLSKALLMR